MQMPCPCAMADAHPDTALTPGRPETYRSSGRGHACSTLSLSSDTESETCTARSARRRVSDVFGVAVNRTQHCAALSTSRLTHRSHRCVGQSFTHPASRLRSLRAPRLGGAITVVPWHASTNSCSLLATRKKSPSRKETARVSKRSRRLEHADNRGTIRADNRQHKQHKQTCAPRPHSS